MRVLIIANDTRGGVQPYVALGAGLQAAGHDVVILAPDNAEGMARDHGLGFRALGGNVEDAARELGGGMPAGGVRGLRATAREMEGRLVEWTRAARAAMDDMDLALGGIGGMVVARAAAEAAGVPFMEAHLQPVGAPTDRYPGALFASPPAILGGLGRRLSHRATEMALWMPFKRPMAKVRSAELRLDGPFRLQGDGPILYGFSPAVVPVPDGGPRPRIVTGWWFLDAGSWTPPEELEAFLADRRRPVVSIGFGSMVGGDPAGLASLVVGAVQDAGVRAVLLTGWGGLADGPNASDDVFVATSVPHDWLFARVDAIVHHGGAGTTGAGLRAGVPNVVVPFGVDQPFWASRVRAAGAGPVPLPRGGLTRESLAGALDQAVHDQAMRDAAAALGGVIRAEDGVGSAVRAIERAFG